MALLLPFTISRYSQNTLTGPPVTDYSAWLNGSDLVASGTNVSNWKDEKALLNIGGWGTLAPTYNPNYRNGYGGISFNSTDPSTNQTVPTSGARIDCRGTNSITIMNAWVVDNTTGCRTLAGISTDGSTNNFLIWGQGMNAGSLPGTTVWIRTGNGSEVLAAGPTLSISIGTLIIYTATYTQISSNTSTITFSVNNANTVTSNSTQFSTNQFYLTPVSEGYYSPASYNPHRSTNSTLLETLVWSRLLNSTEQSNMYNYFLVRYSIPTLSVSATTATVTIPASYSGISIALFSNTIPSTSGGSIYSVGYTSGTTATFSNLPTGYYYASINGSTSYTSIVAVVAGPTVPLTDMTTWLNAGLGVVTSGGNVTTWYDANNYLNIIGWSSYSVTSNASYANGYGAIMTPATSTTIPFFSGKPSSSATFNWRTTSTLTYITVCMISNVSSYVDINSISTGDNGYSNDLQLSGARSTGTTINGVSFGTVAASNTMPSFTAGSLAVTIATYSYNGTTVTEKISINNGTSNAVTSTNANDLLSSNVKLFPVSEPTINNGGSYPSTAANGIAILDKMLWTRVLSATEQSNIYNYFTIKYATALSLSLTTTTATVTVTPSNSAGVPIVLYQNTTASTTGGTVYGSNTTTGNTATFSITSGYYYYASLLGSTKYTSIGYVAPFTGSDQSFVVPSGISSMNVSMSGAGGVNTYSGGGGTGGKGGFVSGTLAVTPGETLVLVVGGTGGQSTGATYGGGGAGQTGGSGGGRSAIRRSGVDIVTAAGGGGGGYGTGGGDGGGLTGGNGGQGSGSRGQGGFGGTQSVGGAGGYDATYGQAQGGSQYQGGIVSGGWGAYTGGGGGGYDGGGAGVYGGGGGGGSSYVANLTGTVVNTLGGGSSAEVAGYIIMVM